MPGGTQKHIYFIDGNKGIVYVHENQGISN